MQYSSQNIKLSFGRPKYETIGHTVKCTLSYTINVPAMIASDEIVKGHNNEIAVVNTGTMFDFNGAFGGEITSSGYAQCHPNDNFDKSVGRKIARARAEQSAYSFARKLVAEYVNKVIDRFASIVESFDIKSSNIIEEDKRFIGDLSEHYTY